MLQLMTTGDAAHRLRVSVSTIREFALAGLLEVAGRTTKGWRLFHERDVDELRRERIANPPRPGRRPRKEKRR
jgi:DNA-binding transcriptional MerR regulator